MSTPEYEIVPAVPGDLDALERIESQCFGASVAISRRQFRYLLRAPGASVYVLRAGGPLGLGRHCLGEGGSASSTPSSSLYSTLRRRPEGSLTA